MYSWHNIIKLEVNEQDSKPFDIFWEGYLMAVVLHQNGRMPREP